MNNFFQKITKYISDNPKIIMFFIVILILLIIWLYASSKNIFSSFSSKKKEKNKLKRKINDESSDDEEINSPDTSELKNKNFQKKNTTDPAISQLVKDINMNST